MQPGPTQRAGVAPPTDAEQHEHDVPWPTARRIVGLVMEAVRRAQHAEWLRRRSVERQLHDGAALRLFVTPKAVEKHIANIFSQLNLHSDTAEHHRRVLAVLTYVRSQQDEHHLGGRGPAV